MIKSSIIIYHEQQLNGNTLTYNSYPLDHLGSVRDVSATSLTSKQVNHYYPFGGLIDISTGGDVQAYKYNGKELDWVKSLNLYDYHARQYDAAIGRFTTMDPLAEKYYSISPYAYCGNNPVNAIDPIGESTWVKDIGDGKYEVIGGDLDDDDFNIYTGEFDDEGKFINRTSIGVTSSLTSFYNSDNKTWMTGSVINTKDYSGIQFLDLIQNQSPSLLEYIPNARNNKLYDFKVSNGGLQSPNKEPNSVLFMYRGMPTGYYYKNIPIYSSARDIGNIAAGFVAGVHGINWKMTRFAFDSYQYLTDGCLEGISSINAQQIGWITGRKRFSQQLKSILQRIWSLNLSLP